VSTIDVNADLGEGFGVWTLGDDDALLGVITSANVACGFHAGDPSTMRRVCAGAVAGGVAIGAQVSYRDLAGFGRRFVDVAPAELTDDVLYQLAALDGIARASGGRVRYLKPHGALYHDAARSERTAAAVVEAVALYDPTLPVLGLAGSVLLARAEARGLVSVPEAFADRAYTGEGLLVSRREPGSVLHDVEAVAARCVQLATRGVVASVDGSTVEVRARSICVHGDTPGAVEMARAVKLALHDAGVELRRFTGEPSTSA
jgi:UPF0271 protein